ncbi:hypothetical protein RJ640_012464 [Escallonia rubra]|uniref:Retrovirus-related Pol polyprotein from transposon TNT 1-94-like beta-barrel domain-containing protein n=1 Tax=Escallonia rubra TaxID=112253 RepID=A0AA88QZB3_9ASTE|nr:hypothetical protein RJ640_012464 [Escallonia rubra]
MVEEAIKEEDSSDEDIIGYKTVTISIRRSMSSRVETIHVMTTTSINDTVKKNLKEKGLTGDELEEGIQDIMSITKGKRRSEKMNNKQMAGCHPFNIDALVDTGAFYCMARLGILPSEKWIKIDQLMSMRMTNGDEFEPEYEAYHIQMKTIFRSMGLWDLVKNGFTEHESMENLTENQKKKLEEGRQKDANAHFIMQRGVTKSIFPRIIRATKAKEACDILKVEYYGDDKVRAINLQTLRRDFENMKMKGNETLAEFFTKFMDLINQMKSHDEEISNRRIVEKVLISLPEKFDPKVTIIEETKDIFELGVQKLMASLKSYKQRLARHSEKSIESAFQSKLIVGSSKNDERKFQNLEQIRKHTFGGKGVAEETEDEGNLFYSCQSVMEHKRDVWFLDSGCSNHMAGNESIFIHMDSTFKSQVKLGNRALIEAKGKGTIGIQTNEGDRFIRDVQLVPNLDQNLRSVGQLLEHGYKLDFEGNGCIIYDNGKPRQLVKKIRMESSNEKMIQAFKEEMM